MFQSSSGEKPDLQPAAATEYRPTQISREKYEKIVQGRNRFFLITICGVGLFMGISALPQFLIYRSVRRLYKTYCRGKVLDLSPKLYDEKDVALYEMSKAVRVEFMIDQKVVDDGHYRVDETLTEEEQEERRRAMTLNFMIRNDYNWVGSTVNFTTVLRSDAQVRGFEKYDCVLVRDELLNYTEARSRNIFDSAAQYMKEEDGLFLVMDFGKSSYPQLTRLARWFNKVSNSSMSVTHDYHAWIRESMLYEVKEEHRCLLGFYYALVLQRRRSPTAVPLTNSAAPAAKTPPSSPEGK